MKVRFSESFLASHRINQRERMQKYTCRCSWHALKFSPLRLVSSFWLSGHLFLAMQFISDFIWVNLRWNGPTWQAKTIISCFFNWKERIARARDRNTALVNQSASQDCRFATNQCLKSADLWYRLKKNRAGFKTQPPAFGLGRVNYGQRK